jgi:hypothetical protein
MDHKKFQYKSGIVKQTTRAKQESEATPPPPPPTPASSSPPDVAALLNDLIDKKLAALVQQKSVQPVQQPVQDKDFAMIEESITEAPIPVKESAKQEVKQEVKPKLPRPTLTAKPKLEAKKLVIEEDDKRAEFEQLVAEFNKERSVQNEAKKKVDEARKIILDTMSDNLLYDGDTLAVNIKEVSNQSVNATAVVEALVDLKSENIDEIKAGVQQILDLARLGIIEFGKTNFERWVKGHGYDPKPFIIDHEKEKRIYVTPK